MHTIAHARTGLHVCAVHTIAHARAALHVCAVHAIAHVRIVLHVCAVHTIAHARTVLHVCSAVANAIRSRFHMYDISSYHVIRNRCCSIANSGSGVILGSFCDSFLQVHSARLMEKLLAARLPASSIIIIVIAPCIGCI